MPGRKTLPLALVVALGSTPFLATPALAAPPTAPYISEIHYDNTGTDSGEFVEVWLPAGTSSAGLSVVLYNGGTATAAVPYDTDALPAVTAPADAPAVATVSYAANGIQNGSPDGVALVRNGTVVEFLSYEGAMTAAAAPTGGPAAGQTATDIGVAEAGTEPVGPVPLPDVRRCSRPPRLGRPRGRDPGPGQPGRRGAEHLRRDPDPPDRRGPGRRLLDPARRRHGDRPRHRGRRRARTRRLLPPGRRRRRQPGDLRRRLRRRERPGHRPR